MAIEMQAASAESALAGPAENIAPARTFASEKTTDKKSDVSFAPGWAPAVLTDRGTAMCRLSAFINAFEALGTEDRAWFAHPLSELLVTACEAETALR